MSDAPDGVAGTQRMAALAVRHGLSLGVMRSAAPGDFAVMLVAASQAFASHEVYSERSVNERLSAWLADAGAMLAIDHVELRRWLVDTGVLMRDGYGRAYSLGTPSSPIGALMAALGTIDLAAVARAARALDAAEREVRKTQWTSRTAVGDA
jgi:hypothetical protein